MPGSQRHLTSGSGIVSCVQSIIYRGKGGRIKTIKKKKDIGTPLKIKKKTQLYSKHSVSVLRIAKILTSFG